MIRSNSRKLEGEKRVIMGRIFQDKLPKILPKVRKAMYLRSSRISSEINKKKSLPGLKTKDKEEIWKATKKKKKAPDYQLKKDIIYKQFLTADFSAKTVKVRRQ